MATASSLRKYMDESGEMPRDVLLGHIVLFTINDGQYDRKQVEQWFDQLGLNPTFLPETNRPIDAYKKATTEADDYEYALPNGTTAHVLVRDVSTDGEMIVRHLIREIKDSRRKRLAHGKIGEAVFYRPTSHRGQQTPGSERFRLGIDKDQLTEHEREAMDPLVQQITTSYDRHCNYMDGMKVRAMVREYVKYLNSVTLKSGVYFVPVTRRDELGLLQQLVDLLGHGCTLQLVPLVDLAEQRSMVVAAFHTEVAESLSEIVKKIAKVRETRKTITPETYVRIKAEYDTVVNRASEYTRTLGVSKDKVAGAADFALEQLAALQHQMLETGAA